MGVATRGVKFKFTSGERVLCYEPDPTKAKVLYESKVLELVVSRDDRGRKVAEYLIHFFGWNSSWDRCVREEFILPFTDENRELQTKLAKDAALSIKGKRKSKLPPLIKETLFKKFCSDSSNEKPVETECSDSSSETDSSEDEAEKDVTLNIPDILKLQLEEDWRHITQKNKLVKLPCQPNVVSILEAFVKHSAAKLLCASPPRNGKQLMPDDVQTKLNVCKEAMDGLRVYFDFTLPHLLLYSNEKSQYYTDGTHCCPASSNTHRETATLNSLKVEQHSSDDCSKSESPLKREPVVIKQEPGSPVRPQKGRPSARNSHLKGNPPPKSETSPNNALDVKFQTTMPPAKNIKRKRGRPKTVPTRTLRSGDKRKGRPAIKQKQSSTVNEVKQQSVFKQKQQPEEASATRTITQPETETRMSEPGPSTEGRVTRKSVLHHNPRFVDRTPTGLLPSPALSLGSSNCVSSSESSCGTATVGHSQFHLLQTAGLLQEVLHWRLLPPTLYEQIPAAPSLIYGAQHLLRLFVKLPDLISKMSISSRKLAPLLTILEQFMTYLCEQRDRLFLPSAYVDASDDSK